METKKTIENLLIECRELLANKIFPLAENELVESHVSSSFEFGYICGALRYRELTDGDNALEPKQKQIEVNLEKEIDSFFTDWEEGGGYDFSITNADNRVIRLNDIMDVARHFYELGLNARKEETK